MNIKVIKIQTEDELINALNIRREVFINEQNIPETIEIDKYDQLDNKEVLHFLLYKDKNPIATLRYISTQDYLKIGRVAVLKEYRNQGYGKELMVQSMSYIEQQNLFNIKNKYFYLESQKIAIPFYEALNFKSFGEYFLEANIEHKKMKRMPND